MVVNDVLRRPINL